MSSDDHYASLGMYDFPALGPAQDAWWAGLAGHFSAAGFSNVPSALNRSVADPYDVWLAPNLFFAQTCGYPLTHRLAGRVRLLGTPCYDAPGTAGASYRSLYIVRSDAKPGSLAMALSGRVAINARDSFSGWRVLSGLIEPASTLVISGSHAKSIDLVRQGDADIAAIDCVSHALLGDVEPARLAGTRVIEQSPLAPGLPYITALGMGAPEVRAMIKAINKAFADPDLAPARKTLRLAGFNVVALSDYIRTMTENE